MMTSTLLRSWKWIGNIGVVLATSSAFASPQAPLSPGDPLPGLTPAELVRFEAGKAQFQKVDTPADGLGPVFNANSCVTCHAGPAPGGSSEVLATRIGIQTRKGFDPLFQFGGPTIQAQGIGMVPGANFVAEIVPPQAKIVAHRRSNPVFGFGLVDAVPDSTFVDLAKQQRRHSPATAGRPNIVHNLRTGLTGVGRFGWKAQMGSVYDFAADAYKDEIGVTTAGFTMPGMVNPDGTPQVFPFFRSDDGRLVSEENPPQGNISLLQFDPIPGPDEPDDRDILHLTDFMTMLAPPPGQPVTPNALKGKTLFSKLGCASCHVPSLTTGAHPIAALQNKTFFAYSDFLLHDMGKLGDGISAAQAHGSEMRTAPLWGLSALPFYLHDGRAETIESAIHLHDGQGKASAKKFDALPHRSKVELLEFLDSL